MSFILWLVYRRHVWYELIDGKWRTCKCKHKSFFDGFGSSWLHFISTYGNNSAGLYAMIQEQAEKIQAQVDQRCAKNKVIRMLKEENGKFTRNIQKLMHTLGLNNVTANGTTES
ncbi:hypothetical protein C5167_016467 [Papaver somniferum]|nr:hypothetical protein C5167_016467 [Papaver somniferum]